MLVTAQDVGRVAALARLDLSAEEEARLTVELGRILDYMERLNQLDTESVTPSAHPIPVTGTMREDKPEAFGHIDDMLAQAPDRRDGYYRVPRVIE